MAKISVHKFGGTSVDKMSHVHDILECEAKNSHPVAVVSAFSGHTDQILRAVGWVIRHRGQAKNQAAVEHLFEPVVESLTEKIRNAFGDACDEGYYASTLHSLCSLLYGQIIPSLAHDIIQEATSPQSDEDFAARVTDRAIGLGELISHHTLTRFFALRSNFERQFVSVDLSETINSSIHVSPEHAHIVPRDAVFEAVVDNVRGKLQACLKKNAIPIIGGYVGKVPGGILQVIDRGYTDTTAALTAVAARGLPHGPHDVSYTIHKEVPGVMSADPRVVEEGYNPTKHRTERDFQHVRVVHTMSFRELAELSVLARMKAVNENVLYVLDGEDVELRVKNTVDPEAPGTTITRHGDVNHEGIRFIAGITGQTMLTVQSNKMAHQHSVAGRIFTACGELGIPVDAITTSATSVSFSIPGDHSRFFDLTEKLFEIGEVQIRENMALISCIGNNMACTKGLLAKVTAVFPANGINIEFDGGNPDGNITFVIKDEDYEKAIKALHRELIEKV